MPPISDPRSDAAMGMMRGGSPEEDPLAGLDLGQPPGGEGDLDSALVSLERAIEGKPTDIKEEIMTHVEAIREVASKDTGEGAQPSEEPVPPGASEVPPPLPGGPSPVGGGPGAGLLGLGG